MTALDLKDKIMNLLDQAAREEQAFLATLSDEQRASAGAPERWSAKDILAHLAVWKERMVEGLDAAAQGKPYPAFDDFDQSNAEIFEAHRHDPWKDVVERSERATSTLIRRIQAVEIADFTKTDMMAWQRGRPLWRLIVMNGYYHPIDHLSRYYVDHGSKHEGKSYATQIEEEMAESLSTLDDDPVWQGTVIYNLACYYVLSVAHEKAISRLDEAFKLAPDLREWAKQDPDLASIRGELVL